MNNSESEHILENAGIRPTPVRMLIVRELANAETPLSGLDLEDRLDTVDRSSITRALALFTEKGLVHSIDDGSASIKYELCHHRGEEEHSDLHVHFHCLDCGRTFCFEDQEIPPVQLPDGFSVTTSNYVVKGRCPECGRRR